MKGEWLVVDGKVIGFVVDDRVLELDEIMPLVYQDIRLHHSYHEAMKNARDNKETIKR